MNSGMLGMYYIYDRVGECPVSQLILAKNDVVAMLGFDMTLKSEQFKRYASKNYELRKVGECTDDEYIIDPASCKISVITQGDVVHTQLEQSGVLNAELEDVMES